MGTAILIHGCHLQAKGWENIVWGRPQEGVLGRVPRGLQLASGIGEEFTEEVSMIFWGTGASEKNGVKESEYTFNYAMERLGELDLSYPGFAGMTRDELREFIREVSVIDTESQNTPQEVERAMRMCCGQGIKKLVLVSSPTHIARCLQGAEVIRAKGGFEGLEIFATASDTCFADSTPADVLIVEPPHRGDRPEVPVHKTLKRAMRLGRGEHAEDFNIALDRFLLEWEQH